MKSYINKITGILGLILGLTAVIAVSIFPSKNLFNAVITGLALILLLTFFVFHFETFKAFSKRRSTQLGLNSIMMIALFIFITVVFNLMARQYYLRLDLSSTSSYSLAPQTVDVVKKLESEIKITVFGQESRPTFKKAKELLEGYRYLNRNIVYSVVDLDRAPLLAKEHEVTQYDSIVVKEKGNSVFGEASTVSSAEPLSRTVVVQGINEETITNAIIKATRKVRKKIYFITGQGERDIHNSGRNGMSKALSRLNSIGYDTNVLSLSAVESVPDDADLLMIVGPKQKFSKEDTVKLDKFMARGGKLLALFDPGYDSSGISGKVGIRLRNAMVIDPSSNLGGKDEKVPLVSSYPDTPITRDFKLSTVYPGVAPLQVGGLERIYEYFNIVTTSSGSRLMKDGKVIPAETQTYVIAAAAGSRKGKDILIVFGDSDFASNAFFDVAGNGNLFLNSVNWMAEEGDLVSIAPRKDDFIPLYLTPEQSRAIMYVSVVGIPFSVFGLGLFIWWRRRRL